MADFDLVKTIKITATADGVDKSRESTEKFSSAISQLSEENRKNTITLRDAINNQESYADKLLKVATGLGILAAAGLAVKSVFSVLGDVISGTADALDTVAKKSASILPDNIRAYTTSWARTNELVKEYIDLAGRAGALDISTGFYQQQTKAAETLKITNDSIIKQMEALKSATAEKLGGSDGQKRVDELVKFGNFDGNTGVDELKSATTQEEKYKAVVSLIDQAVTAGERLAAIDVAKTMLGADAAANLQKDSEYFDKIQSAADKLTEKTLIPDADVSRALDLQNRLQAATDVINKQWFPAQRDGLNPLVMFFKELWVDIVELVASAFTWVEKITKSMLSIPGDLWQKFQNWRHGGEAEGPQQETPDEALKRGTNALRTGLQNPNTVKQAGEQTLSASDVLRKDKSHAAAPDAPDTSAYGRAEESLRKYIETSNAAAASVDMNIEAQERLKAIAQLTAAGMKDGLTREAAAAKAELSGLAVQAGVAADQLAKAKIASDIKFGRNTSLLSPDDVAIASKLKGLYPDVATALNSVQASGLRTNAALSGVSSQLSGQLTTDIADVLDHTKSLGQGAADMGKMFVRAVDEMIVKLLIVGPLMRALQGGVSSWLGIGSKATDGIGGFGPTAPGHAAGTDSSPGGWHWVGENGPELMNVPKGAQVLPNGKMPDSGGVSAPVSIHIDATGADAAGLARVQQQLADLKTNLPATIVKTVQKAKTNRVLA